MLFSVHLFGVCLLSAIPSPLPYATDIAMSKHSTHLEGTYNHILCLCGVGMRDDMNMLCTSEN